VEIDRLRPHSTAKQEPISLEKHEIDIPEVLSEWVHNPGNLRDHVKDKCGAFGLALAHPKAGNNKNAKGNKGNSKALKLVLLGTSSAASKAQMLLKLHSKHQVGLRGLKTQAAGLEKDLEEERKKRGNSVVEEFSVDAALVGMIVGKGGSNIRTAEKESGVHSAVIQNNKVLLLIFSSP